MILYCFIVLVVMILLNTLLFPRLMRQEITQVDYGTFLTMLKVAVAQVEQDVIYFVTPPRSLACTPDHLP